MQGVLGVQGGLVAARLCCSVKSLLRFTLGYVVGWASAWRGVQRAGPCNQARAGHVSVNTPPIGLATRPWLPVISPVSRPVVWCAPLLPVWCALRASKHRQCYVVHSPQQHTEGFLRAQGPAAAVWQLTTLCCTNESSTASSVQGLVVLSGPACHTWSVSCWVLVVVPLLLHL